MRLDPSAGFDNMHDRGIKGTTDWQEYEVTLPMIPETTKQIALGGLLVGKGTMWLDDLRVLIDGKELASAQPFIKKLLPADTDKEFDNGSQLNNIPTDSVTIQRLKKLGLIWGFAKYYHPTIARGEVHWDYELFRALPAILSAKQEQDYESVLIRWLNKLGKYEQQKTTRDTMKEIKLYPDLKWIEQSGFSSQLKTLLLSMVTAQRPAEHYYIGVLGAGNPEFKNEHYYAKQKSYSRRLEKCAE